MFITAKTETEDRIKGFELGADDYLTKPCTAREILNHLDTEQQTSANNEESDQVMSVNRLEWEHIQRVLKDNDGNISAAARALGMHRRTLQRKLQKRPAKS